MIICKDSLKILKKADNLVLRLNEKQVIELTHVTNNRKIESITIFENEFYQYNSMMKYRGDHVSLYLSQCKFYQTLVSNLKINDVLMFVYEDNSSENLREVGITTIFVSAIVKRKDKIYQYYIDSVNQKNDGQYNSIKKRGY